MPCIRHPGQQCAVCYPCGSGSQSACQPPVPLTQEITALYLSGPMPFPPLQEARAIEQQSAKLQLPGRPNQSINVQVTALVKQSFVPVITNFTLQTDSEGYFEIPLTEGCQFVRFRIRFTVLGDAMEANCYEPIGTREIWADPDDLRLRAAVNRVLRFNIDTSARDHSVGYPGEQKGPCKAARATAIAQLAVFEALNSITHQFTSRFSVAPVSSTASKEAAMAQANHDTLLWLYPGQASELAAELVSNLATITNGTSKSAGIAAGSAAAAAVIAARSSDGAPPPGTPEESYVDYVARVYGANPIPLGDWTQDPVSLFPPAMGSTWGTTVQPFVIPSASTYRCPPLPALNSKEFAMAYNEVKCMGGDPNAASTPTTAPTLTVRSEDNTFVGIYWAVRVFVLFIFSLSPLLM